MNCPIYYIFTKECFDYTILKQLTMCSNIVLLGLFCSDLIKNSIWPFYEHEIVIKIITLLNNNCIIYCLSFYYVYN